MSPQWPQDFSKLLNSLLEWRFSLFPWKFPEHTIWTLPPASPTPNLVLIPLILFLLKHFHLLSFYIIYSFTSSIAYGLSPVPWWPSQPQLRKNRSSERMGHLFVPSVIYLKHQEWCQAHFRSSVYQLNNDLWALNQESCLKEQLYPGCDIGHPTPTSPGWGCKAAGVQPRTPQSRGCQQHQNWLINHPCGCIWATVLLGFFSECLPVSWDWFCSHLSDVVTKTILLKTIFLLTSANEDGFLC